jgi:hypothetical protein
VEKRIENRYRERKNIEDCQYFQAKQEKDLAEKQSEANGALQMITDTMRNANTQVSVNIIKLFER